MHLFSQAAIFYQIVLPYFLIKNGCFVLHSLYFHVFKQIQQHWSQKKWINRSSRPEMFCKKVDLRNFPKFTGKHHFQSFFFYKLAGLRLATLLKKRLWHRRFPVSFAKLLRTPFLAEHLRWLLLNEERVTW